VTNFQTLWLGITTLGATLPVLCISAVSYWLSKQSYKYWIFFYFKLALYLNAVALVFTSMNIGLQPKDLKYINQPTQTYSIKTKTVSKQDLSILEQRFMSALPSRYSRVLFDSDKNTITFKRGAPAPETIKALSEKKGRFRLFSKPPQKEWINNSHIAKLSVSEHLSTGLPALQIRLSSDGGRIMHTNSQQHIGIILTAELDQVEIQEATIVDTLGISFQIGNIGDLEDAKLSVLLITHGPLSQKIILEPL